MKRLLLAFLLVATPAPAQTIPAETAAPRVGVTSSATGTTAAVTATLPAVQGHVNFLCTIVVQLTNATALQNGSITTTGLVNNLTIGAPTLALGATVLNPPPTVIPFTPCIPASGPNVAISVTSPALGTGAPLNTVTLWGTKHADIGERHER